MPAHNNAQKQPAIYERKSASYMATAMDNTANTWVTSLTRGDDGKWMMDLHDGSGPVPLNKNVYDPNFLVDNISTNDPNGGIVTLDLLNCTKLKLFIKGGNDREFRATRIYLDETTVNSINLCV